MPRGIVPFGGAVWRTEIMGYANADSVKVTLNRIRKKIKDGAADAGLSSYWQRHPSPY